MQSNLTISNSTGYEFRQNVMKALKTVYETQVSTEEPSETFPGAKWADSSVVPLRTKVRNSENTSWLHQPGVYQYDSTIFSDSAFVGYDKGDIVLRSDGQGYWFNTVENNITDPEASGAAAAGWVPDFTAGAASVTMTSANVTLTPDQYGKPIIVITGALTSNLNLIFPRIAQGWAIINASTGDYTITAKTLSGIGIVLAEGLNHVVFDGINAHSATIFIQSGSGAVQRQQADKLRENVSVQDFGAEPSNVIDSSSGIIAAAAVGANVTFPRGEYLYTSEANPEFQGKVIVDGATVNNTIVQDLLAFDADGETYVGLHENHLQQTTKPNSNGHIGVAPMSKAAISGPVDLIGHFYNDFGLQGSAGWNGWYSWEWNFVGASAPYSYDPSRHPLLGWYRGDEINVLDWQCYWLREYGVNTIIPVGAINAATWANPNDAQYWLYQLFNNVKNFKGMRYIPWVLSDSGTPSTVASNWTGVIYDICGTYKNAYTIQQDGKTYLCLFIWDGEALRGILDGFGGSVDAGFAFMSARANEAKIVGYDGICAMARNPGAYGAAWNNIDGETNAKNAGFLYISSGYGGFTGNPQNNTANVTYSDLVNGIDVPQSPRTISYVSTAMESQYPHTSGWTWGGSTPDLFKKALDITIKQILKTKQPRIITIYNVAEWAEGGPGLQPNRRDGFAYLEACRNVLNESVPQIAPTFNYDRADVRTSNIKPSSNTVLFWSDFSATLSGATYHPTITPGQDGQKIRIISYPLLAEYSLTINSESFEAGTNLFLTANQVTLGPWDSVELQYFAGKGWVQIGNVVNVL